LYKYETWSVTVREEHRLRVFENRVLRRIFRPRREEVVGGWKDCILRSFITHFTKYYWDGQVKEDEMGRACIIHRRDEK